MRGLFALVAQRIEHLTTDLPGAIDAANPYLTRPDVIGVSSVPAKSEVQISRALLGSTRATSTTTYDLADNPLQDTIVRQGGMVNMGLSENVRD
jgi:hypothetical protein